MKKSLKGYLGDITRDRVLNILLHDSKGQPENVGDARWRACVRQVWDDNLLNQVAELEKQLDTSPPPSHNER